METKVRDSIFIITEPKEHQQKCLLTGHYYEEQMLDFIQQNYFVKGLTDKRKGTFVDIGACIGNHTLFFSKIADKVIAFEPVEANYQLLLANIKRNNLENVETYKVALGNASGKIDIFTFGKIDVLASIQAKRAGQEKQRIDIEKLDNYCLDNVDLIKIDVEGYNIPVLTGAIETLKKNKPNIFIELNPIGELVKAEKFLLPLGYKLYPKVFNATPTYLFYI